MKTITYEAIVPLLKANKLRKQCPEGVDDNYYSPWLPAINKKCFENNQIPIESIKSDPEMAKLSSQYHFWQQNRELILQRIIHRMTHIWFWLYLDNDLYRSWFHGKPFINLMASYGIDCDTEGRHSGVSEQFWRLIRDL